MNLPSHLKARFEESWRERAAQLVETLQHWPWLETARTLRQRFREDHLGLTASSLTFTTLISLVPLVTVTLALFSAFPMFASFQESLQKYFLQSLVPDNIAKPVMTALTQFAAKANRLGTVGLVFLFFAALALMLTIDRTLNAIWRVRTPRPIAQRVLVYWAAATLGPLVLGVSLSLTSYVISASRGLVSELPGGVSLLLNTIEFVLLAAGMAALFHYVPNTHVSWRHAIAGGVFVSVGFEVAKKALAWYIAQVPTFAVVYGAFATLPILLVWIYLGWVIVLLGAVIAAYAPSLRMRVARWPDGPGSRFALALALLTELDRARGSEARGLSLAELSETLRVDPLQAEPIVDLLTEMDWLARLDEPGAARYVLLADPLVTPAAPLLSRLLLEPSPALSAFRDRAGFDRLTLAELLRA
ncbi:YihY family inner membrane protein [Variovorax sp. YR752]|uniref:YihY family inner membrane protein n=1 Tax=Variovorax sp. YR752 TaxID=1884383 RepID=UPI003137B421